MTYFQIIFLSQFVMVSNVLKFVQHWCLRTSEISEVSSNSLPIKCEGVNLYTPQDVFAWEQCALTVPYIEVPCVQAPTSTTCLHQTGRNSKLGQVINLLDTTTMQDLLQTIALIVVNYLNHFIKFTVIYSARLVARETSLYENSLNSLSHEMSQAMNISHYGRYMGMSQIS